MRPAILSAALIALLAPAGAVADVYKWTDERGVTVLSSAPPDETAPARHVEVVARETKRTKGASAAAATYEERARSEQMLLDRIESLERELRAQQYSREAAAPPASQVGYYTTPYQGSYYATPAPPPHWDYPPAYYGYPWPYVSVYPAFGTGFHRSHGHFRHKHFPHASTHGKFSRGVAHGGMPRTGSFHRGRR